MFPFMLILESPVPAVLLPLKLLIPATSYDTAPVNVPICTPTPSPVTTFLSVGDPMGALELNFVDPAVFIDGTGAVNATALAFAVAAAVDAADADFIFQSHVAVARARLIW